MRCSSLPCRAGLRSTSRWQNWRVFASVSRSTSATTRSTDSLPFRHWRSTSPWQSRRRVQSPSTPNSNIPSGLTQSSLCATHRNALKTSCSKCSKSIRLFDVFSKRYLLYGFSWLFYFTLSLFYPLVCCISLIQYYWLWDRKLKIILDCRWSNRWYKTYSL